MKRSGIPKSLRLLVEERANSRCEYCRMRSRYSTIPFHVEHIISLRHLGTTTLDNLAFSCPICNFKKGTDIATLSADGQGFTRFFHPRKDEWDSFFEVTKYGAFSPKNEIAEATIRFLDLNHPDSIRERFMLIQAGIF